MPTNSERLSGIVERIKFGLPTETFDDLRFLAEMATGEPIPVKKRCTGCGGDGMIRDAESLDDCPVCSGSGFQKETALMPA